MAKSGDKVKTGIYLELELYEAVRKLAYERRSGTNAVIVEAIRAFLDAKQPAEVPHMPGGLNEVEGKCVELLLVVLRGPKTRGVEAIKMNLEAFGELSALADFALAADAEINPGGFRGLDGRRLMKASEEEPEDE